MTVRCCLCSDEVSVFYKPIGSCIRMEIGICHECGLIQAVYDHKLYQRSNDQQPDFERGIEKLSCDAGYSEVRVGKGQMAETPFRFFQKFVEPKLIRRVLDMRSARGDFARKAIEFFKLESIDCIEGDTYITESYASDSRFNLKIGKYYEHFSRQKYDLVYSCHSFEHYRDPLRYASYLRDRVLRGGFLFIEVPNPEVVLDGVNFEEFFYDKHVTYFTKDILVSFFESFGFDTISTSSNESASISILFRLGRENCRPGRFGSRLLYDKGRELLSFYKTNIDSNRARIPEISARMTSFIDGKVSLAVGVGRLFDSFNVYSTCPPNFSFLVDNFLNGRMPAYDGKPVFSLADLKVIPSAGICFTRKRSSSLEASLYQRFPGIEVKHFSDFF